MEQLEKEILDSIKMSGCEEAPTYNNTYQGMVFYSGICYYNNKEYFVTYGFNEEEVKEAENKYPENPQEEFPWDDAHIIEIIEK